MPTKLTPVEPAAFKANVPPGEDHHRHNSHKRESRTVVTINAHHVASGVQHVGSTPRFVLPTETDDESYQRPRQAVSVEWLALDKGWVAKPSSLVVENVDGSEMRIGILAGEVVVEFAPIGPGRASFLEVVDADWFDRLRVRSLGESKFRCRVFPA